MDVMLSFIAPVGILFCIAVVCYPPSRTWIRQHRAVLEISLAGIAGFCVFLEYRNSVIDGKLQRAIAVIEQGRSGDLMNTRLWIDVFKLEHADEIHAGIDAFSKTGNTDKLDNLTAEIMSSDGKAQRRILQLFQYYSQIAICANSEVCDPALLCQHVGKDIGYDYSMFFEVIDSSKSLGFADRYDGIRKFVDYCKSSEAP